jgi:hypothetical protein
LVAIGQELVEFMKRQHLLPPVRCFCTRRIVQNGGRTHDISFQDVAANLTWKNGRNLRRNSKRKKIGNVTKREENQKTKKRDGKQE